MASWTPPLVTVSTAAGLVVAPKEFVITTANATLLSVAASVGVVYDGPVAPAMAAPARVH